MRSNHTILVFKMRNLLYTLLLFFLVSLLILCLILMFTRQDSQKQEGRPQTEDTEPVQSQIASTYRSGIYTSELTLGDSSVDVEVTVDHDQIKAIRLVNLSEATAASFPLVTPSLQNLTEQILNTQSLDGLTCPQEHQYTSQILLSAVAEALALASE